ncbi:MAG: ATPase domain-containing protein [Thermoanaerobaculia bacterium]
MYYQRVLSGISGLDEVLKGGFIPNRFYLIRGKSGTGKSTLGLYFLLEGIKSKEKVLYITLEESETKIRKNAELKGIDLNGIEFLDISPTSEYFAKVQAYDIFSSVEVEREPLTKAIVEKVKSLNPKRIFLDSITQFKLLCSDTYQCRKMILSFLRFLTEANATVLFTSEISKQISDDDLIFISDGVLKLDYDGKLRTIQIEKFRGSGYSNGLHSLKISDKGIEVFPKIYYMGRKIEYKKEILSSGISEIDNTLGGGIEKGTINIITGPSGTGKTTLSLCFLREAALQGKKVFFYSFDEDLEFILERCKAINMDLNGVKDNLILFKIPPSLYTIEEFFYILKNDIEKYKPEIIALDSIPSLQNSFLKSIDKIELSLLTKNLKNFGISLIIINETELEPGQIKLPEDEITFLADNIIFLHHIIIEGQIKKIFGLLKKRLSDFDKSLREFEITKDGIKIGSPLKNFKGFSLGIPEITKNL